MKKTFRAGMIQWNRIDLRFPLNDLQEIFCRNSLISLFKNTGRMRFIFSTLICCLLLQVLACGQNSNKLDSKNNDSSNFVQQTIELIDTTLVKMEFPEEVGIEYQSYRVRDKKLPKTKTLGNIQLKLKDGNYVVYENMKGYLCEELIPNVVKFQEPNEKIEFYDNIGRTLLKTLDFTDNPYLKAGITNLQIGYPDQEYYHPLGNHNIELVREKSTEYFTGNKIYQSKHNYVAIAYFLIGATVESKMNKYENTVFIYDKTGKKINAAKINHAIEQMIVSDDGRYLCFTYGGGANGDVTSPENEVATIYDMATKKYIMELKALDDTYVGEFEEIAPFILSTGVVSTGNRAIFYANNVLIDLNKKMMYSKVFESDQENTNFWGESNNLFVENPYSKPLRNQFFKQQKL